MGCTWIFKKNDEISGVEKARYKARLVAKGFSQREGINFNEIFSPVVKHCFIRLILALVARDDLELEQLDVKTTFLHEELEEVIYMDQPLGFVEGKNKVCLLERSLYGLKQSLKQWYKRFDEYILKIWFERSKFDSCVYVKKVEDSVMVYLLLYVNDMLIASKSKSEIYVVKAKLQK